MTEFPRSVRGRDLAGGGQQERLGGFWTRTALNQNRTDWSLGAEGANPRFLRYIAWLPKVNLETENRYPSTSLFSYCGFYRGGFRICGLRTLWSRVPISISCNVALGEPIPFP